MPNENVRTFVKTLVLVGGGHSHVLVLKHWAAQPRAGVKVILISPGPKTPYSGMLPGLVAGHYRFDETHIDLVALCRRAGATFIQAAVTAVDVEKRRVHTDTGEPIAADVLSIDCGSTPDLSVDGARAQVVPVKPIAGFYERWQTVNTRLQQSSTRQHIAIVGGGAAGVELAMAMDHYWRRLAPPPQHPQLHLVQQGAGLPENYPRRMQTLLAHRFRRLGIQVHDNFTVQQVTGGRLLGENGALAPDDIFWCTQASAAPWPRASGIDTDAGGFIKVNDALQSLNHDWIFAAGDIAHQVDHPRPKAGVFAVRQGPVLFDNLCRRLGEQPLATFTPQRRFLSLLACGEQYAIGTKYGITFHGRWVWRWKDRIDRRFMNQFHGL